MANSNSGKHARKVTLDAAVSNAIEKAVDARKVAAFTVGAAGVLAGAAFAFGATPAMAAEAGAADAAQTPVAADEKAGSEAGKKDDGKKAASKDNEAKDAETQDDAKKDQTDTNKEVGEQSDKKEDTTEEQNKQSVVKTDDKKSDKEEKKQETTVVGQDRASNNDANSSQIKPDTTDTTNTKINIDENNAGTMPNAYAWGSSDNTFSEDGEKHTVTFHFAAPKDGMITNIAIFPAQNNGLNNDKSRRGAEYYSGDATMRQNFSGTYEFTKNGDGSADLKMSNLFSKGTVNGGAEKYVASRSIFVYVTNKDGKEDVAYKTNVFRAVTLVPPKTSGSVVLKYNEQLTPKKVKAAITEAGNIETARSDKKSVNDQLSGKFTENINVDSSDPYDAKQFAAINTETSAKDAKNKTYVAGAKTLNTYMVTDLGFKSEAIPLTVARYDDRIDKPIVEDPTQLSQEVKEDIAKKLAKINGVTPDKIKFDGDNAVINFDGVDAKDAPKIALRDLVLKQLKDGEFAVPTADKAVFVANPLDYSKDEIARIKKAIFDANKDKKELGLTEADYENQISLSYLTGNFTKAGKANQGISNGQAENTITVKIKTDKAVAEFTSNVKENKLTKLPNIRTDYDVSWTKTKIDGRDTDEGISWSNDQKTTIIYRYDPTKAQEFDTTKILGLLKATPKDKQAGLRELNGGELLGYEGTGNNAQKSHMHYALQGGEPTGELTLGNMNGPYWFGNQKVSNSDEKLGDAESEAGSYSWDTEAGPVKVAGKKGKIFKARLFVEPYAMSYYKDVYLEQGRNPGNTAKAINVIFVPQTNHKTSDLSKSIGEHKTENVDGEDVPTQSAYYNASKDKKDAYEKALDAAKTLYDSVKDTDESKLTEDQKADIDNATINLNKARAELDGDNTDKTKLEQSINDHGKAEEGKAPTGTQATNQFKNVSDPDFKKADGSDDTERNNAAREAKKAYDKALEDAKALKDDANATQKAVDEAKAKLDEARKKLNDFTTNKDGLSAAIATDGKVNTGDTSKQGDEKLKTADPTYQNSTPEQRKAYDDAVAQADKVSKDPNASQKEVNKAIDDLKKAKAVLDANATDKSPLDAAVQKSFDNPSNDESKQSVFYKNAAAKKDTDPAAKKAVEDYDKALAEAKRVLGDKNATKADVDNAKKALEDAEAALHDDKYQTKATDLAEAIADNFSGYLMPAYFNAFDKAQAKGKDSQAAKDFKAYNDAYHAAKDLLKDIKKPNSTVTQDQANKVKDKLVEARKAIDKYATDTSKISAALLHSLAITNSPAYKNASATDASEDAKKAAKAYDDALKALKKAFDNDMDKDKDSKGNEIPESVIPKKGGDTGSANYLDGIQAHAKKQPLNRDVTKLLAKLKEAVKGLDEFKTNTDDLIKSVNEDATTHPSPAFKNAAAPSFKKADGSDDTDRNREAKAAADAYGQALAEAKAKLNDPAATQKDINDAKDKLDKARKALDAYNTDTTKLEKSVAAHGTETVEGTKNSDAYRNASDPHFMKADTTDPTKLVEDTQKNDEAKKAKADYDKALAEAQELLKKHGDKDTPQDAKPTQKQINDALDALDKARTKLDTYKTDTSKLDEEAQKSTADGAAQPTAGSFEDSPEFKNADAKKKDGADGKKVDNDDVKAYKDALAKARKLAQDNTSNTLSDHHTQKEIDDALEALKKAKQTITDTYKTDASLLKDAKDFANGGFKDTPEYKNAVVLKDDNSDTDKQSKAKAAVEALDENTNNGALKKAIEILKKFDENGKPKEGQTSPTQKEVDDALATLKAAMDKVTKDYQTKVDPLVKEVGDKDQDGTPVTPPFEASVPYKNALAKSNAGDATAKEKLKNYADKLAEAQKLIDQVNKPDPNAKPEDRPTQKQVDDALAALKQAKKDIDDTFKTNASALKNEADDKDEHGTAHTPAFESSPEYKNALAKKGDGQEDIPDVKEYQAALKKAQDLLKKFSDDGSAPKQGEKDIPTQQEVDEALKNLKEIKEKIKKNYVTSPHDLQQEVDKSKDGEDDTSTDVFENTPAFKNAQAKGDDAAKNALEDYNKKLKAAKDLLDKFDRTTGKPRTDLPAGTKIPTQKELDEALDALQAAKKKIEDDYSTSKSNLRQEAGDDFTKSPEYQNAQAKGDDESKQALEDYKKALDEANSVLDDPNATQSEVDAALKKLKAAKDKLRDENGTDKSKLQTEADDDANFRKSVYFIIGNKDDIEAYNTALAEARSVLKDPNATQAQVDEALRKLKAAKYKLNHPFGAGSGSGIGSGYDTDANAGDGFAVETSASQSASVDKTALQIEVNNAVDTNANTAEARAYRKALAEARRVLSDKNATQAQVDAALRSLKAAKAALLNSLRGASGLKLAKTGVETSMFASIAAAFAGFGVAGVASRRRKHSNE